ncbi:MAG: tetratricopeptide repeat protein [Acidobacteria bacterium]|nr:tetratricopeptide repeat protein [Acidobacteriota bacterium]
MSQDRWSQVKALFQQALERDGAERSEFIRGVTGDDTTLRYELESLLSSHDEAGTFLSNPPGAAAAEVLQLDDDAPLTGKRVGPYRVLRRVGRGGTGSVYLAVRDDEEFQQRVALKVIRRGMATEEMLNRFRSERQILASIDHPNIARLLDGGSTEDGLPYFVMEYIEGESIHHYCDNNRLSLKARIELFRTVCDAVQVAHQNLIVHRDLKPGNILVTSDGKAKLLDFGIAKLLNPELNADAHDPTMLELRVMTPEYASPEQMQGRAVTTASDVYSLGVLLYELLTGHRPYSVSNLPLHEMEVLVSTVEPPLPSEIVGQSAEEPGRDGGVREITPESVAQGRQASPDRLSRDLVGDLDNIVRKALRKEAPRRYSSVERLSDDLGNHLEGRPVLARPDTLGYRASKFLGRHRVPTAMAATALVFGVLLTATIFLQSRRVAAERDRATQQALRAEAVSDFLQDVLAAADPIEGMGRDVSVLASVEEAVPRIAATFVGQPELEGAVRHTIGRTFGRLGRFDEAEEQLRLALTTRRQLFGTDHPDIADTLNALGEVRYDLGDLDGAERLYDESLAMRQRVFGEPSAEVAASLDNLGNVYQDRFDTAEAERAYRGALEMRRAVFGTDHREIASSLNNVATVLHDREQLEAAEQLYRESLAISKNALGDRHPEVATSLNNLAVLLHDEGKYTEAEPAYRESLDISRDRLGDMHPDLVVSLVNFAMLLRELDRNDEAEELLLQSLAISESTWGPDGVPLGTAQRNLGDLALASGDPAGALAWFEQAIEIFSRKLPTDDVDLVFAQADKGRALIALGDHAAGEECLVVAYNSFLQSYGEEDSDVIEFAGWLADLYDAWDRPVLAASFRAVHEGAAKARPAELVGTP